MLHLDWLRNRLVFGKPARPPETVVDVRFHYARMRKLCDQMSWWGRIILAVMAVTLPLHSPDWIEHITLIISGTTGLMLIQMYRQLVSQTEHWFLQYMEQIEKNAIIMHKHRAFVDRQFQLRVDLMMADYLHSMQVHPIVPPSKGMSQ